MQEVIKIEDLAKILVNTFYNRIHMPTQWDKEAIEENCSENTGWKNFYDIRLDNVADWGFCEAARIWKKLEKEIQQKYRVEVYHDKSLFRNRWYTWQRHKKLKFNNNELQVALGSKMTYPRHPKECSNTVYFTVNSKELYDAIFKEYERVKNNINDKNHEVKIGSITYTTEDIANAVKKNPKVLVNLVKDILDTQVPEKKYHEVIKPLTKAILEKMTQVSFVGDVAKYVYKAAYIKSGGDGTDW